MSKAKKERGAAAKLGELIESGDHRAARAEAARLLADPSVTEEDRAAAAEAGASLRPEPAAVVVGLLGLVAAALITARVLLG